MNADFKYAYRMVLKHRMAIVVNGPATLGWYDAPFVIWGGRLVMVIDE